LFKVHLTWPFKQAQDAGLSNKVVWQALAPELNKRLSEVPSRLYFENLSDFVNKFKFREEFYRLGKLDLNLGDYSNPWDWFLNKYEEAVSAAGEVLSKKGIDVKLSIKDIIKTIDRDDLAKRVYNDAVIRRWFSEPYFKQGRMINTTGDVWIYYKDDKPGSLISDLKGVTNKSRRSLIRHMKPFLEVYERWSGQLREGFEKHLDVYSDPSEHLDDEKSPLDYLANILVKSFASKWFLSENKKSKVLNEFSTSRQELDILEEIKKERNYPDFKSIVKEDFTMELFEQGFITPYLQNLNGTLDNFDELVNAIPTLQVLLTPIGIDLPDDMQREQQLFDRYRAIKGDVVALGEKTIDKLEELYYKIRDDSSSIEAILEPFVKRYKTNMIRIPEIYSGDEDAKTQFFELIKDVKHNLAKYETARNNLNSMSCDNEGIHQINDLVDYKFYVLGESMKYLLTNLEMVSDGLLQGEDDKAGLKHYGDVRSILDGVDELDERNALESFALSNLLRRALYYSPDVLKKEMPEDFYFVAVSYDPVRINSVATGENFKMYSLGHESIPKIVERDLPDEVLRSYLIFDNLSAHDVKKSSALFYECDLFEDNPYILENELKNDKNASIRRRQTSL
jgi:hypothetical protein